MESALDKVAMGQASYLSVVQRCDQRLDMELNNWFDQHPREESVDCVCGGQLKLRQNRKKKSTFVGCTNYPNCKITFETLEQAKESSMMSETA
jgi:ssDNA-binding Zn-finger/Zn-ribbon topoisomerase 1